MVNWGEKKESSLLNVEVPIELHSEFKALAARHGLTMSDVIRAAIRMYLSASADAAILRRWAEAEKEREE